MRPVRLIVPASKYLLAILNSKLADYYIRRLGVTRNGGYFEYKPMFIERLPVPFVSDAEQEKISGWADEIIKMKATGQNSGKIEELIDELIFQIYALDKDEIEFVNQANTK